MTKALFAYVILFLRVHHALQASGLGEDTPWTPPPSGRLGPSIPPLLPPELLGSRSPTSPPPLLGSPEEDWNNDCLYDWNHGMIYDLDEFIRENQNGPLFEKSCSSSHDGGSEESEPDLIFGPLSPLSSTPLQRALDHPRSKKLFDEDLLGALQAEQEEQELLSPTTAGGLSSGRHLRGRCISNTSSFGFGSASDTTPGEGDSGGSPSDVDTSPRRGMAGVVMPGVVSGFRTTRPRLSSLSEGRYEPDLVCPRYRKVGTNVVDADWC